MEIVELISSNQAEVQRHIADADLVANAVLAFMKDRHVWEGTSTALLDALKDLTSEEQRRDRCWPKAANILSNRLRQAAPGLRMMHLGVAERMLHGKTIWTLFWENKEDKKDNATHRTHPTPSDVNASQNNSLAKSDRGEMEGGVGGQSHAPTPPHQIP